ncbi:phenylacetate--CoA ligase family protein [Geomonas anaerohicana]|uniref:Phenylacetate--CoA ligase family protein n=1 Tax=Geomonas anaerohicana TaxID=2798583 RepID=A0ABS0YBX5_9BACT|nr:phenylacetate--CoA ligase family protein [Geomonas anaerohicana]MBJ6749829.1 phenylacetate--CoA ligase family protein [Geomonas anaerohicana]
MLEAIYNGSPVWLQHVLVSAAGLRLHLQRKGGGYQRYLAQALEAEKLTAVLLEELQLRLLRDLVGYCLHAVPFYRDWNSRNHLNPADLKHVRDIACLPIIDKDAIRTDPEIYCANGSLKKRGTFQLHTSGTTGKPLTIFCDAESRRRHYAYWERFLKWYGVGSNSRRATFCGRLVVPQMHNTAPFWRHDPVQNNLLFSSYHICDANIPFYLERLRRYQPAYLDGYPSTIAVIARYILEHGLPPLPSLHAVFTSAETLLPDQRSAMEEAFKVPVADQYGCTEMAIFVSQCPYGSYHLNSDYSLLEVLDSQGEAAPSGQLGEVVCTVFVNKIMPLLRYRLGDLVTAPEPSSCGCGLHFPVIEQIFGRKDDAIRTLDGRIVGRMDPLFKGLSNIIETQVVQTQKDTLLVRLVPAKNFCAKDEDKLLLALKARVGGQLSIKIEKVDAIPREPNGKFRAVISHVRD